MNSTLLEQFTHQVGPLELVNENYNQDERYKLELNILFIHNKMITLD